MPRGERNNEKNLNLCFITSFKNSRLVAISHSTFISSYYMKKAKWNFSKKFENEKHLKSDRKSTYILLQSTGNEGEKKMKKKEKSNFRESKLLYLAEGIVFENLFFSDILFVAHDHVLNDFLCLFTQFLHACFDRFYS